MCKAVKGVILAWISISLVVLVALALGPLAPIETGSDLLVVGLVSLAAGGGGSLLLFGLLLVLSLGVRRGGGGFRPGNLEAFLSISAVFALGVCFFKAALTPSPSPWLLIAGALGAVVAGKGVGAAAAGARAGSRTALAQAPGPARRLCIPLALLAALALGFWLRPSAPAPPVSSLSQGMAAIGSRPGMKVLCVFVDGVDGQELEALASAFGPGDSTSLAWGGDVAPSCFWHTLVTGHDPSDHGLSGSRARRALARRHPVYEAVVQSVFLDALEEVAGFSPLDAWRPVNPYATGLKPVWTVVSESGHTAGVINVGFTWPAPEVRRFSVSDVAFRRLSQEPVHGSDRLDSRGLLWPLEEEAWVEDIQRLGRKRSAKARSPDTVFLEDFLAVQALDAGVKRFTPIPDFLAVEFIGPDLIHLAGMKTGDRKKHLADLREALKARSRIWRPRPSGQMVVFVGHPGTFRTGLPATVWLSLPAAFSHDPGTVDPRDLVPTLLHGIGIPLSRELAGAVDPRLLPEEIAGLEVRFVASYGRKQPEAGPEIPLHHPVASDLPYLK